MNKQVFRSLLGVICLSLASQASFAQEEWEETGEIENAEVVIEKDRKIDLPAASRTYQKVPPRADDQTPDSLEYDFTKHQFSGTSYQPPIKVNQLPGSSEVVPGYGYAKLGFGNYISPVAELSVHGVNRSLAAGLDFHHLSFARGPVDGENSASSDNDARIYLRSSGKKNTTQVNLDFSTMKRFHYGFSEGSRSEIDPTEQRYNQFGTSISLKNSDDEADLDYDINLGFYTLDDQFSAGESAFQGNLKFSRPLNDDITLFTDIDLLFSSYREIVDINRNLGKLKGGVVYQIGPLSITAAANLAMQNDTISNANDFKVYPYAMVDYKLDDQWTIKAGVLGDVEAVTLRGVVDQNPFIARNVALNHSNKQIEIFGEITGRVTPEFDVTAGMSFSDYENLYFFTDTLRFDLAYDDDTKVFNAYASANYNHPSKLSVNSRFDYYAYNTGFLAEAWHRPQFVSSISAKYPVNSKVNTGMSLSILTGIRAFDPASNDMVTLDAIFDLSIDAQYLVNDKIRAFLELDNLLGKQYERFINYPNRSVMVHLGAIYSF